MKTALLSAALALGLVGAAACAGAKDDASNDPDTLAGPADGGLDLGSTAKKDGGRTTRRDDSGAVIEEVNPAQAAVYATKLVSFTPGACGGFGQASMPGIVFGPPKGGGNSQGSLDVVSLGKGGEIVLSFEPETIVDGPGADFVVFENAFYAGGDPQNPYVELGEVSVSEDGVTWSTFPCTATEAPYGQCAGWHPVQASGEAGDPAAAGGDAYDLATIGVARAKYVRIQDRTSQRCTSQGPDTNGFDLDAIAALHTQRPSGE